LRALFFFLLELVPAGITFPPINASMMHDWDWDWGNFYLVLIPALVLVIF
jgi:hypothetical protein